jgi:hypothetical protein
VCGRHDVLFRRFDDLLFRSAPLFGGLLFRSALLGCCRRRGGGSSGGGSSAVLLGGIPYLQ